MSTFKTTNGEIPLDSFDTVRIDNLVVDNITAKKLYVNVADASSVLFLWDTSGSNFYYSGNVEFPGDISGTTGKYIYKNLVDASSSWDVVLSGTAGNNVTLRNKAGVEYDVISISGTLHHGSGANNSELGIENNLGAHFQGKSGYGVIGTDAYYSHNEGYNNMVTGHGSHAEGWGNLASGRGSHAEGKGNIASGIASHAEGDGCVASGIGSHAYGFKTTSSGKYSLARGEGGVASGEGSLAEGYNGVASGIASHVEGSGCVASGIASHAMGLNTRAVGDYALTGGWGTAMDMSGGAAFGTYNLTKTGALFVVGNGLSDTSRSDAFLVADTGLISTTLPVHTSSIYAYNSTMTIGGVDFFGETVKAASLTAYSDISATAFSGNGLFISDVKGWNYTTNNFIENAKSFVIGDYTGIPIIDTSMSALKIEAVKTVYREFNSENVLLSGKNVANEMIVTNKKSGYVYVKPKADYGPGSKMTLHFPPHLDASSEILNVQVFNDAPRGIKIGNEIINVTKYTGKDIHIVFDDKTVFDTVSDVGTSVIRNATTNFNSAITYTNDTESVTDHIYLSDASGIIYAINSTTHATDWTYTVMSDVPTSDGIRARFPTRGIYDLTCDGVSIGRDGSIYACFAPPAGELLTSGGALVALNPDGTQKWKKWTNLGAGSVSINYTSGTYSDGSMNFAPALMPVLDNSALYVVPSTGVYSHLDNSGANLSCFDVVTQSLVWQYGIGYQNQIKTPPVVNKNGRVFFLYTWVDTGDNANNTVLEAIDRNNTGTVDAPLWTFSGLGKSYTNGSTLSINQTGEIIVATIDGIYLIEEFVDVFGNTQGRIKWNYILNNINRQPQSIARDGTIYLTGGFIDNYKLFAIKTSPYNANSGLVSWESDSKAIVYGGSVVDKDGNIYICNTTGSILSINSSGTLLWSKVLQTVNPTWAPTPAIGANGILYVSIDGEKIDAGGQTIPNTALIAINKSDGTELWRWEGSSGSSLQGILRTTNFEGQWPMYGYDYNTKGAVDFYGTAFSNTYTADTFLYSDTTNTVGDGSQTTSGSSSNSGYGY